ncbi:MAG TPA: 7-cyano-7-deazaguanine/7-aminomethyl-7-deazaguanine transporter [Gammaproteobacteria bacterium]|jgi:uncharacterized integral membrane protein (TIGR00697 family)|nr:7-cyano-7-deazaguanine/7-aminomethyl-7-deazaguanine transporter [Gammaproteobacteria bacterium]
MSTVLPPAARSILLALIAVHLLIIAASNYLVQIPVQFLGLHTTWGAVSFPLVFLATDLTVRIYGAATARRIILGAMLPALVISYVFSVLFYQGVFQGFSGFSQLNTFVARIAVASLLAYLAGQLLDVRVFSYFRAHHAWWVAPALSTVIGGFIDTLLFFSIAFYRSSDTFMAEHWPEIAIVDYGFKLAISLALFVPAYGIFMNAISARLRQHPG